MARTDPTIYMRIAPELKERLEKAALENRRSIAAEVSSRLQRTFDEDGSPPGAQLPLAVDQQEIIQLTRKKDLLSLQIASLQSRALQVVERIRTAMVDDSTTDDLHHLHVQRGEIYSQLDVFQTEMAAVVGKLEAAYQRIDGNSQGIQMMKIEKAE